MAASRTTVEEATAEAQRYYGYMISNSGSLAECWFCGKRDAASVSFYPCIAKSFLDIGPSVVSCEMAACQHQMRLTQQAFCRCRLLFALVPSDQRLAVRRSNGDIEQHYEASKLFFDEDAGRFKLQVLLITATGKILKNIYLEDAVALNPELRCTLYHNVFVADSLITQINNAAGRQVVMKSDHM